MAARTIDVTPVPCVCGRARCGQRNRNFLPHGLGADRVVVFLNANDPRQTPFWTWCPVQRGERIDRGIDMGHYDTLQRAYEDARRYTLGLSPAAAVMAR